MPKIRTTKTWPLATGVFAGSAFASGPDLVVPTILSVARWGTRDGIVAYSVGTIVCNVGDEIHEWDRFTSHHPVIAQNLYRVKDGRLEHIGISWVKHTFAADVASVCGTCTIPPGYNGQQLGVGCADAYSASINGEVWTLGPRSQVSATTGVFAYPVDLTGYPAATPTIGRRVQVPVADVDPAQNAGARYFAESQFVSAQEAAAGNGANSTGYREFTVAANYDWAVAADTRQSQTAIHAWAEVYPDVRISTLSVPGDGVIVLGSRAVDLGDGRWRYIYAVQNLTSDRGVGSLAVPTPSCVETTFRPGRLPSYHSGEPWSNAAWVAERAASTCLWRTPATFAQDPASSAVRWGSVGTFEMIATAPPVAGRVGIGLFGPGTGADFGVPGVVPGGSADFNGDGFLDFFDYDDFVLAYESGASTADVNGDGFLDFFDYDAFVSSFELGCV